MTGVKYNGGWKDNRRHGNGKQKYADDSEYVGEFINGLKEGSGTLTKADGTSYTGGWKGNKKHGNGILSRVDNSKY